MAYINAGGLPLFQKFVRHLSNYSVMQVVERLFLHQPGWEGKSQVDRHFALTNACMHGSLLGGTVDRQFAHRWMHASLT